jgi:glycosyltransferase involved in cell wall biosynthesis
MVAAVPLSLKVFMRPHMEVIARRYPMTAICDGSAGGLEGVFPAGVTFQSVGIERKISPLRDLQALLALIQIFSARKFALVHSITPKAGLLAMLAARMAGIPIRLHVFTGQVWATKRGFKRWFLKQFDRLIACLATNVLADSGSQRDFLVTEGVVSASRIRVLGKGSICGVDAARFKPDSSLRRRQRSRWGLPDDAVLALFLGRLNQEKGVLDLAEAFGALAAELPQLHLAIVGPDEEGLVPQIRSLCPGQEHRLHIVGFTDSPNEMMNAADIFCLPSYREGFGSVVIEAAAVGVPALASRIYGITDAVDENSTGLLHRPGDSSDIASGLRRLVEDADLRRQMGEAARERALRDFSVEGVTGALAAYYDELIEGAGRG